MRFRNSLWDRFSTGRPLVAARERQVTNLSHSHETAFGTTGGTLLILPS
jgi:hypothetical protein